MNLQQIDEALAAWNDRLAAVAGNLLELQSESTYQLLAGSGRTPRLPLTGATAARVEPALGAMHNMFQHFGVLKSAVDRATELRADLRGGFSTLFSGDDKIRQIRHLLFERSLDLRAQGVPLQSAGGPVPDCVSPDELVVIMARSFTLARDAVRAVDAAWKKLAAELDLLQQQMAQAVAEASALGPQLQPELNAAYQHLQQIQARAQSDPLGALEDLDNRSRPVLARVHAALAAAQRTRQSFVAAHAALAELARTHGDSLQLAAEARAKIGSSTTLPEPLPDATLTALRDWLQRLEQRRSGSTAEAIEIGLRNWEAAAADAQAQAQALAAAARSALEHRDELRGRLDALKAKARAYSMAEHPELCAHAARAEALLYSRPADLVEAARALLALEQMLLGTRIRSGVTQEANPQ